MEMRIQERLGQIPDVRQVRYDKNSGVLRLDVSLSFGDDTPILKLLMDEGAPIYTLQSEKPDLETTFLALTGKRFA
jgi:hypothetical protein